MTRLGILCALVLFATCPVWAQDPGATTTTAPDNAGQNTNSSPQATTSTPSSQQDSATRKTEAQDDEAAADQHKEAAKQANSKLQETREKVESRLDDSAKILNQLLGAPDKSIPDDIYKSAKCVAVIPSMVKGGFIFGAEHGRGVATCRTSNGWSAPAFFTMTGGSWGAQIGGQAVDLVMLVMNDKGMQDMLSANFNFGGDASAAAGPVGRDASATTDWKLKSEVLTYSRARGLYAGAILKGASLREDDDSTIAFYGHRAGFRSILMGDVTAPSNASAERFLATVRRDHHEPAVQGR